ncbi:ABC transporter ATP-binding protein [Soehngenia saccharolytica]|nr:ABC transporter ATP-binding protein [Soehngenia saccharolytica]
MNKLIEASNLNVNYGDEKVLTDVSFTIYENDFIGLVGENGSGKTTLIKALLGIIPSTSGRIEYYGSKENMTIGYLPQVLVTGNIKFPALVNEIVGLGLLGNKKYPKRITKSDMYKIEDTLSKVGAADLKNKKIGDLSGGQQQKVLLARALVNNPKLLVLDEPTSALDPKAREEIFDIIDNLNKMGTAILLVSHDIQSLMKRAKKMMLIDREILYFGPSTDFKLNSFY